MRIKESTRGGMNFFNPRHKIGIFGGTLIFILNRGVFHLIMKN